MEYSSPFASKELKSVEKKKGVKYPTMKAAFDISLNKKLKKSAKQFLSNFRSPYSK